MSLFDTIERSEHIRASDIARTRNSTPITLTVTKQRITCSISIEAIDKSGISLGDSVDISFSKDGRMLMVERSEKGFKLSTQGKDPKNASVRLTNKEGTYPDFIAIHVCKELFENVKNETDDKVVLVSENIEYDKENRRVACVLKVR